MRVLGADVITSEKYDYRDVEKIRFDLGAAILTRESEGEKTVVHRKGIHSIK
jgi:hypothetical protein